MIVRAAIHLRRIGENMSIFSRRRVQLMLDHVTPTISEDKSKDLVGRLNSDKVDQCLPAQIEIALLDAILQTGDLEVEPEWLAPPSRPDAYSETVVQGKSCAIEIAATCDNSASPIHNMTKVGREILEAIRKIKPRIVGHVRFTFHETAGYDHGEYYRYVLAPEDFKVTPRHLARLSDWINSESFKSDKLIFQETGLAVSMVYNKQKCHEIERCVYTSMPAEIHSYKKNPIFSLLTRKATQLRGVPDNVIKIIILADVGSTTLNRMGKIGETDTTRRRISAKEIVSHFLEKNPATVDAIVVLVPQRARSGNFPFGNTSFGKILWKEFIFEDQQQDVELAKEISKLLKSLPPPLQEGYQARSAFRQGGYHPRRSPPYLSARYEWTQMNENEHTISISARALLDFLAGRIDESRFRFALGENGTPGLIRPLLERGKTLRSVRMGDREIDSDDDYLVFTLEDDAAARPFAHRTSTVAESPSSEPK